MKLSNSQEKLITKKQKKNKTETDKLHIMHEPLYLPTPIHNPCQTITLQNHIHSSQILMPSATGTSQNPPPKPTGMDDRPSSAPIKIDDSEIDAAFANSALLTRPEVIRRRARRVKQLARIYRDHYWALMEDLKWKYREYYLEYGRSPFVEDDDEEGKIDGDANGENAGGVNGYGGESPNRCGVHGCKAKPMALTRFCSMHILSDAKQKLYKACNFSIKSSATGPILCGKPILSSTVPSYCASHYEKADRYMVRALKKSGLSASSTSKCAPKFHVLTSEYVGQIMSKRRAVQQAKLEIGEVKQENHS